MNSNIATLAAVTVFALGFGAARADIIITQAPGSNVGTDNVVFNPCGGAIETGPALTVQGCLNNNHAIIVGFTGQENLVVNGGQARIDAEDGAFSWLQIFLDPLATSAFTKLIFNVNTVQGDSGEMTIDVDVTNAADVSETFTIAQGQNFFHVEAFAGQLIRSVTLESTVGVDFVAFDDVRQVRIGGSGILPEPHAVLLLATVLGAAVLGARRRAPHR